MRNLWTAVAAKLRPIAGIFLILLLLSPFAASAQDLPEALNDTVSDFARVIPAVEETRLSSDMTLRRDQTGVHVVVVTMNRMQGAKPGERIETYATRLFNHWGIGDAGRNDGILILVVTGDRAARIALGSGYDSVYDGRATRVIETAMLPAFRDGRLADGIIAGVASAQERLVAPYLAGKPVTVDEGFPKPFDKTMLWIIGLIGGGAALVFGGRAGGVERPCTLPAMPASHTHTPQRGSVACHDLQFGERDTAFQLFQLWLRPVDGLHDRPTARRRRSQRPQQWRGRQQQQWWRIWWWRIVRRGWHGQMVDANPYPLPHADIPAKLAGHAHGTARHAIRTRS